MKKNKLKIRCWDIETSLTIVTTFSLRNDYIHPDSILQDWNMLCAAWKLTGEDKVESTCVKAKDVTDDRDVVEHCREMIMDTDILIHHNGKRFDLKKLNTRILKHGLKPIDPHLRQVDTLIQAKKHFGFTANRLDYIAKFLGVGSKIPHSGNLWQNVLKGDSKALKEMVLYNKNDVVILDNVYQLMRPYIDHPNIATLNDLSCPHCGNCNVMKNGKRRTNTGLEYQRYQCTTCFAYCSDRALIEKTLLK